MSKTLRLPSCRLSPGNLPTLKSDSSPLIAHRSLLLFRRQRQSEHGNHSLAGNVDLGFVGIGQVERLAIFAAIDFGVRSPSLLDVAALALNHVLRIEPAFQMAAAELALFVLFVAGTLSGLLDLHFVMGKLLEVRAAHCRGRQRMYPRS